MFGSFTPKRAGLFAQPAPVTTPGIGDGQGSQAWEGIPSTGTAPISTMPAFSAEPKKAAFFGEGGAGRAIAGALGDVLLQRGGLAPAYADAMKQKQQELMAIRMQQARALTDRQDFLFEQKYKQDHQDPHYWESNDGSLMGVGPDGQARMVYKDPTPKTDWIKVQNPDGTMTIMPVPQGGAAPAAAPAITEDQWNAGTPVGGAGSGQQGFRP